jgi:hypothetical protein
MGMSAQWTIAVRDGDIALQGSHSVGDSWIFLKSLRDTSFNKDLSNDPTFGRIHVAGQYFKCRAMCLQSFMNIFKLQYTV